MRPKGGSKGMKAGKILGSGRNGQEPAARLRG